MILQNFWALKCKLRKLLLSQSAITYPTKPPSLRKNLEKAINNLVPSPTMISKYSNNFMKWIAEHNLSNWRVWKKFSCIYGHEHESVYNHRNNGRRSSQENGFGVIYYTLSPQHKISLIIFSLIYFYMHGGSSLLFLSLGDDISF